MPTRSRRWRRRMASSAGPPTSTPRSPTRRTTIFFDAGTTQMRPRLLEQAIEAGKHIYCEKPIATNLAEALKICRLAEAKGVKNGVVQDKLFLPGLLKLEDAARLRLLRPHADGARRVRLLGVRGRLDQPAQRPSWNYRNEDGGGMILDMVCHWRYVLDNLFGEVRRSPASARRTFPSAWTRAASHIQGDRGRRGLRHLRARGGVIAHINMSWATRVYRDDLVTFQVDGTHGSAVAGLQDCVMQPRPATPRPVWNPGREADRSISVPPGSGCRTTRPTTTASRRSGRCSSATSSRTRPTATRCSKARRACSSSRRAAELERAPLGRRAAAAVWGGGGAGDGGE